MQDLQSIAGGRLLGAALERRLRPIGHHHGHHQAALKCPRCESTNTKFCYYNNYNLSQPRHFCKNCRRYWTKGGVLRNVPVGGGCRKNKRSSKHKPSPPPEQPPPATDTSATAVPAEPPATANSQLKSSSAYSDSESSGLTASATEAISGAAHPVTSFPSGAGLLGICNYDSFVVPASDPNDLRGGAFPNVLLGQRNEGGAYTAAAGNFTGLVRGSTEPILGGLELSSLMLSHQNSHDMCQQHQWQNQDQCQTAMIGGLFDQTVQVDLSAMGGGGFGPSDWQVKDQGAFELTTTDDQAYWSQGQSQWTHRDQGHEPESLHPVNLSQFLF